MSKHEPPINCYIISSQTNIKSIRTDEHQMRSDWPLISGRTLFISILIPYILPYILYLGASAFRNQIETSAAQLQAHQYLNAIRQADFASALQHCKGAQNISQQIVQWGGSDIDEIRFEPLERSHPSIGTVRSLVIHFTAHPTHQTQPQQGTIVMNWLFPDFTWWAVPASKSCSALILSPQESMERPK